MLLVKTVTYIVCFLTMTTVLERAPRAHKEKLDHNSLIITVDGSTTAGKRLVAEQLADKYDLTVLNTGSSIRALALLAIENNLVGTDETNVTTIPVDFAQRIVEMYDTMPHKLTIEKPRTDERIARVMVGKRDMYGELLTFRKQKAIENLSSVIAASPVIRERLYDLWRGAVRELGGVVVVGRKTGVDLFPDAPIKLYLFASPEASAAYRIRHDPTASLRQSSEEQYIRERDGRDMARGLLTWPKDAMMIDTSEYIVRQNGPELLGQVVSSMIERQFVIK